MATEPVRAFIAIELPAGWKQALGGLAARLKTAGPTAVKWVEPNGIHLTLKFLGNIPPGRVPVILGEMQAAAAGVSPLRLETGELGVFPNARNCRVAWVGLRGDLDALGDLQQRVEVKMDGLGFSREKRAFTPHLTLARLRDSASPVERQQFGEAFLQAGLDTSGALEVTGINLMRSRLTPAGAIYSRLGSAALGNPSGQPR